MSNYHKEGTQESDEYNSDIVDERPRTTDNVFHDVNKDAITASTTTTPFANPRTSTVRSLLGSSMLNPRDKRSMSPRRNGPFQEELSSEGSASPARQTTVQHRPLNGRSDLSTNVHSTQHTAFPRSNCATPLSWPRTDLVEVDSETSRVLDTQQDGTAPTMPRVPPANVLRVPHGRIDLSLDDNRAKTRRVLPKPVPSEGEQGAMPDDYHNRSASVEMIAAPIHRAPVYQNARSRISGMHATSHTRPMPAKAPAPHEQHLLEQRNVNYPQEVFTGAKRRQAPIAGGVRDEDPTTWMTETSGTDIRAQRENTAREEFEGQQHSLFGQNSSAPAVRLSGTGTNKQPIRRAGPPSEPRRTEHSVSRPIRPMRKATEQVQFTDNQIAAFLDTEIDHKIFRWRAEKKWSWDDIIQLAEKFVDGISRAEVEVRYLMMAAKHARGDFDAPKEVLPSTGIPAAALAQTNPYPASSQTRTPVAEMTCAESRAAGSQVFGPEAAITQYQPRPTGTRARVPSAVINQANPRITGQRPAPLGTAAAQPHAPRYGMQPYSSSQAPLAAYQASISPGDTTNTAIGRSPTGGRRISKGKSELQHAANELLAHNSAIKQRDELLARLDEETKRREDAERSAAEHTKASRDTLKLVEDQRNKYKKELEDARKNAKSKNEEDNKKNKKQAEDEGKKAKKDNEEEVKRLTRELSEREKQHKRDLDQVRKESKELLAEQKRKSNLELRNTQLAAAAKTREINMGRVTGSGFSFGNTNNGKDKADGPQPASKPHVRAKSTKAANPVADDRSGNHNDTAGKTTVDNHNHTAGKTTIDTGFLTKNWDELFGVTEAGDEVESESEEPTPEQILEGDLTFFKYQVMRKTWSVDEEPEDEDAQILICGKDYHSLDEANAAAAEEIFQRNGQDNIYVAPNREYHIHSAPPDDDGLASIHVEVPDGHVRVWVKRSLVSRYTGIPTSLDPSAFHKRHQYLLKEETRDADADQNGPAMETADIGLYSFLALANCSAADRLIKRTFFTDTSRIEEVNKRMSDARYDLNDKLDALKDKGELFCEERANREGQRVKVFVTKMKLEGPRN